MPRKRIYKNAKESNKAKMRWINEYNKRTYKSFAIRLYVEQDKELIDYVAKQENKADFFRRIIAEDMRK